MTETDHSSIKPLGVIIAGGRSRRFQSSPDQHIIHADDKFLAPFGEGTLLGHIIGRVQSQLSDVILNINDDISRVASYELDMVSDDLRDNDMSSVGPLGGIHAAMTEAEDRGYSHIITFSADTPFIPHDFVARMIHIVQEQKVSVAYACSRNGDDDRPHPVMAIFDVALQKDLENYIKSGERRVLWWIRQQSHTKVVWHNKNPDPFFNINTARDLKFAVEFLTSDNEEL